VRGRTNVEYRREVFVLTTTRRGGLAQGTAVRRGARAHQAPRRPGPFRTRHRSRRGSRWPIAQGVRRAIHAASSHLSLGRLGLIVNRATTTPRREKRLYRGFAALPGPLAWRGVSGRVPPDARPRSARRSPPDQDSRRLVPLGITDPAVLRLATPMRSEAPDVGGKISEMRPRDLGAGGQMLQAISLNHPRRVICQNVSDPSLLGTGEHGATRLAGRAGLGRRRSAGSSLLAQRVLVAELPSEQRR
jgi:hypothetical protein